MARVSASRPISLVRRAGSPERARLDEELEASTWANYLAATQGLARVDTQPIAGSPRRLAGGRSLAPAPSSMLR